MTLTFPRALPAGIPIAECDFQLQRYELVAALAGTPASGAVRFVSEEAFDPLWHSPFQTGPLSFDQRAAIEAWADSLRGASRSFLTHNPTRPYPGTYPGGFAGLSRAGGGGFDGTATVTALTASTLALGTLPAAFALIAGDMVGLTEDGSTGLYRVVEAATADGSGAVTVTVEPGVPTGLFSTSATANLAKPVCEMIIVPGSFSCRAHGGQPTRASFEGLQRPA